MKHISRMRNLLQGLISRIYHQVCDDNSGGGDVDDDDAASQYHYEGLHHHPPLERPNSSCSRAFPAMFDLFVLEPTMQEQFRLGEAILGLDDVDDYGNCDEGGGGGHLLWVSVYRSNSCFSRGVEHAIHFWSEDGIGIWQRRMVCSGPMCSPGMMSCVMMLDQAHSHCH